MSSSLNVDTRTNLLWNASKSVNDNRVAIVKPSYSKSKIIWYDLLNLLFKQFAWILDWTCFVTLQINLFLFLGKQL